MKNLTKVFSCIYILVVFASCHKDPQTTPVLTQGNIGSDGGTVKTSDGASIEIPAGALSIDKTISITNITQNDTVGNGDCRIYDLKPDGLQFKDSITITLPFDNTFLDLNSQEKNHGIGITVLTDTGWVNLKAKIDLNRKIATVKSVHFSYYVIHFPGNFSNYFNLNKSKNIVKLLVPYYFQGSYNWCMYYSLSMMAKYNKYNIKAPFFCINVQ